jgi:hypothetical protein
MAEVGEPTQYGYAERLMRTIKEEEVDVSEYRDYHDVYQHIGQFIEDVYMHKWVHSALGYLTAAEFEQQWLALPVNERDTLCCPVLWFWLTFDDEELESATGQSSPDHTCCVSQT